MFTLFCAELESERLAASRTECQMLWGNLLQTIVADRGKAGVQKWLIAKAAVIRCKHAGQIVKEVADEGACGTRRQAGGTVETWDKLPLEDAPRSFRARSALAMFSFGLHTVQALDEPEYKHGIVPKQADHALIFRLFICFEQGLAGCRRQIFLVSSSVERRCLPPSNMCAAFFWV